MTNEDLSLVSDLLVLVGTGLMFARIVMFGRALRTLPPAEQQRYPTEGRLPAWRTWLPVVPLMVLLFATNTNLRLAAAAWYVAQTTLDGFAGQRRLQDLGFDPTVCHAQLRTALVGALAGAFFAASIALPAFVGT
jgi:hypothetical protein